MAEKKAEDGQTKATSKKPQTKATSPKIGDMVYYHDGENVSPAIITKLQEKSGEVNLRVIPDMRAIFPVTFIPFGKQKEDVPYWTERE